MPIITDQRVLDKINAGGLTINEKVAALVAVDATTEIYDYLTAHPTATPSEVIAGTLSAIPTELQGYYTEDGMYAQLENWETANEVRWGGDTPVGVTRAASMQPYGFGVGGTPCDLLPDVDPVCSSATWATIDTDFKKQHQVISGEPYPGIWRIMLNLNLEWVSGTPIVGFNCNGDAYTSGIWGFGKVALSSALTNIPVTVWSPPFVPPDGSIVTYVPTWRVESGTVTIPTGETDNYMAMVRIG
jgi:hypothetical protein